MSQQQVEHALEAKDGCGRRRSAMLTATSVTDPVCGMNVDSGASKYRFDHGGITYHFCSAGCRAKFSAIPNANWGLE
jgi:YHS domain-containing protein